MDAVPECHPGMVGAFAPLKEICPDRATPELMELTRRQMQLANGFCRYLEMANAADP